MERNNEHHIVRLSSRPSTPYAPPELLPARPRTVIYPAGQQPLLYRKPVRRVEQRKVIREILSERYYSPKSASSALAFATGSLGKISSLLLIPMIFIQPLLPLYAYAADDSLAPQTAVPADVLGEISVAPPTEVVLPVSTPVETTTQPVFDIPPSVPPMSDATPPPDLGSASDIPPVDVSSEVPPLVPRDTGSITPPEEPIGNEVLATTTSATTNETPSGAESTTPPSPAPQPESVPPQEITPTAPTEFPPELTSITDATTSPLAIADDATTTDSLDSTKADEIAAPPPIGPTPEEIRAQKEAEDAKTRAELRREVEQEFLSGCISFEQSGYYCLKEGAREIGNSAPKEKIITSVDAEIVGGGDKEVVVHRGGETMQITNNDFDDAFPSQDITGQRFVWQGMKNGRWQIFTATLTGTGTPTIEQVTDSRESNFNPKIDGDHIVWQGWADDNWEIMLATRRATSSPFLSEHLPPGNKLMNVGPDWEVNRLTQNAEHDMFPSLHGDIVTWQAHENGEWVVYAYSISQKTKTKLSGDGTKSDHPRFAITWEEHDAEGHTRLMGYDIATGEKMNITNEAEQTRGDPYREPVHAPISQQDQATLPPPTSSGTSTQLRSDDDGGGGNGLGV